MKAKGKGVRLKVILNLREKQWRRTRKTTKQAILESHFNFETLPSLPMALLSLWGVPLLLRDEKIKMWTGKGEEICWWQRGGQKGDEAREIIGRVVEMSLRGGERHKLT